ncbi:MAG: hypothetical protein R3242_11730, partial [Akkermansiaceae bacterium]|nr:hypothetical protein [Akkermansiaceae bacterium]
MSHRAPSPVVYWLVPICIILMVGATLFGLQRGCFGVSHSTRSAHTSALFQQFYTELEQAK